MIPEDIPPNDRPSDRPNYTPEQQKRLDDAIANVKSITSSFIGQRMNADTMGRMKVELTRVIDGYRNDSRFTTTSCGVMWDEMRWWEKCLWWICTKAFWEIGEMMRERARWGEMKHYHWANTDPKSTICATIRINIVAPKSIGFVPIDVMLDTEGQVCGF